MLKVARTKYETIMLNSEDSRFIHLWNYWYIKGSVKIGIYTVSWEKKVKLYQNLNGKTFQTKASKFENVIIFLRSNVDVYK